MKLAERAQQLQPSLTLAINAKARDLQRQGEDICSLSTGEPDFPTPSFIRRAAEKAMEAGHTRYGPAAGEPSLREAIANKLQQDNKLTYGPDEIMVGNGAKQALYTLFQVLLDPGDEVILPAPYWLSYPPMVHLAGGRCVTVPTRQDRNHQLSGTALAAAITPRTRLLVLNSPANPTGTVYPEQALAELARVLRQHPHVALVSDEIYEYILYEQSRHVSFGAVAPDLAERTFVVNGFSKSWAMTGWRLGYLAGPPSVLRKAAALQSQSTSNVCSFVQYGGLAALRGSRECVHTMVAAFAQRRQVLLQALGSMKHVHGLAPQGAFYGFLNIAATNMSSVVFCERLLAEAGVAVVPGAAFGDDHSVRLSFATDIPTLKRGLERLEAFLSRL
ncbi:MAG: aspartate aminotransferase [Candidatus Synechococcus spongiarum 15L]|uniref:Aminotransferase n=2 Tax=Candidatus Synechococcus spongiarum TaxID=431041 RepID=A0A1T1CIR6_9SYNE|nr:MAG: aspartate aminotransferase [Candidatus Synechococcus spongiarum 15L]MCY4360190.1 pyridoxal phosphate-dependent aminotransferase [Cyanobacteria bacterium MAG APA_bin_95]OOV28363.1 aspartate aminotransferase [Candidatus Synechococcus spongiarum LMB bulk15M]